jgi:hypothetical protein
LATVSITPSITKYGSGSETCKRRRERPPRTINNGVPPIAAITIKIIRGIFAYHKKSKYIYRIFTTDSGIYISEPQIIFAITGKEATVPSIKEKTGSKAFQPDNLVIRAKRIAMIPNATGMIIDKTRFETKPIMLPSSPILINEIEAHAIIIEIKAEIRLPENFILSLMGPSGTYCTREIARCESFLVQIIPPRRAENKRK